MSFGNNTPITSSDEEDDNQPLYGNDNQQEAMGGNFTEIHLDDHGQGTPMSDASDIDPNHNQNNDDLWIQIYYEGNLEIFRIHSQHETLRDLRHRINDRDDMHMSDCHFFMRSMEDEYDEEDIDEEELIESGRLLDNEQDVLTRYNHERLSIYWKSFDLTIMDGMDLSLNIRVSQDWTIKKLKDEVERNHNVRLQCLSYNGMELIDTQDLAYYELNKNGFTLISRISISIEDHICEIATDILICDFWDFEMVLTTYLDAERRERHKNAHFYYMGKEISMNEQVYNHQLKNRSKLEYKVDAYPINIYDSEAALNQSRSSGNHQAQDLNAFSLQVYDQWTLNDVKKAYSKLTKKPFMEKEKFLSQEREMEDDVPLWKLRIRDYEKLIIEREQQEIMVTYICCECGSKVNLRRYDSVQCRQCFHGAVYKQRTQRVCQYSCR